LGLQDQGVNEIDYEDAMTVALTLHDEKEQDERDSAEYKQLWTEWHEGMDEATKRDLSGKPLRYLKDFFDSKEERDAFTGSVAPSNANNLLEFTRLDVIPPKVSCTLLPACLKRLAH